MGALAAKRPGHVWSLDFTRVGGLFRSVVVGAVVDGSSRTVIAPRVAPRQPTAQFAVRRVREAARAFGAPAHFVTDHGTQFTAQVSRQARRSLRIRPRYGAVHRHGSIAVIERWWKSMEVECAIGLHLLRALRAIEARFRA
jgi:transposase InsO family protein